MKTRNNHRKEKKKEKGKHRKTMRGGGECKTYEDFYNGNCLIGEGKKKSRGILKSWTWSKFGTPAGVELNKKIPNITSKISKLQIPAIISDITINDSGDDPRGGNTYCKFMYYINDDQLKQLLSTEKGFNYFFHENVTSAVGFINVLYRIYGTKLVSTEIRELIASKITKVNAIKIIEILTSDNDLKTDSIRAPHITTKKPEIGVRFMKSLENKDVWNELKKTINSNSNSNDIIYTKLKKYINNKNSETRSILGFDHRNKVDTKRYILEKCISKDSTKNFIKKINEQEKKDNDDYSVYKNSFPSYVPQIYTILLDNAPDNYLKSVGFDKDDSNNTFQHIVKTRTYDTPLMKKIIDKAIDPDTTEQQPIDFLKCLTNPSTEVLLHFLDNPQIKKYLLTPDKRATATPKKSNIKNYFLPNIVGKTHKRLLTHTKEILNAHNIENVLLDKKLEKITVIGDKFENKIKNSKDYDNFKDVMVGDLTSNTKISDVLDAVKETMLESRTQNITKKKEIEFWEKMTQKDLEGAIAIADELKESKDFNDNILHSEESYNNSLGTAFAIVTHIDKKPETKTDYDSIKLLINDPSIKKKNLR